jgi:adenine-specific DNA-methyltransferase
MKKCKYGQYFTTNKFLKDEVEKLILNNPKIILEPSVGRGDLIEHLSKDISFHLFEIDETIKLLDSLNYKVTYTDFLKEDIKNTYDTIIGNPPYVKTKTGNLYLEFIKKCFNLLNDNGELIFIVPSDFIKLTSSKKIIEELLKYGTFTHFIHPNSEKLFENASIDVIIFRYCKKISDNKVFFNGEEKYLINSNGIITFSTKNKSDDKKLEDYFNVYVGMVTGKEEVFKNKDFGNIEMLNDKNKLDSYILVNNFPTENKDLNEYLLKHKEILLDRKIRKFNESNWFQWGALRNIKTIKENLGKKCIYMKNLTRDSEIAFVDKVQYFGGSLIMLIPKSDIDLDKTIQYLNSFEYRKNYIYSGRFKIGHRQICNSSLT